MPAGTCGGLAVRSRMKPGDRVVWVYSPGRTILSGCRIGEIPGVVVGIHRHRIRIRVHLRGCERIVTVDPENVILSDEVGQ